MGRLVVFLCTRCTVMMDLKCWKRSCHVDDLFVFLWICGRKKIVLCTFFLKQRKRWWWWWSGVVLTTVSHFVPCVHDNIYTHTRTCRSPSIDAGASILFRSSHLSFVSSSSSSSWSCRAAADEIFFSMYADTYTNRKIKDTYIHTHLSLSLVCTVIFQLYPHPATLLMTLLTKWW